MLAKRLVVGGELPSEQRHDPQGWEEVPADSVASGFGRFTGFAPKRIRPAAGGANRLERLLHAPPVDVGLWRDRATPERRRPPRVVFQDRDQSVVLFERERPQHDGVHD